LYGSSGELESQDILKRVDCDNCEYADAVATTVAALKAYAPKLSPSGGAILLWCSTLGIPTAVMIG